VSNKSHACDDCIDFALGMFTLSGMCAACLLMHGDVDDKHYVYTQTLISMCHPLLLLKSVNTSGKAGAQIPHLPLGDDHHPGGDNPVRI
jgi:hypothetical protein